jgi:hypothetical protein
MLAVALLGVALAPRIRTVAAAGLPPADAGGRPGRCRRARHALTPATPIPADEPTVGMSSARRN